MDFQTFEAEARSLSRSLSLSPCPPLTSLDIIALPTFHLHHPPIVLHDIVWEFTIVYSSSYASPVLYFTVATTSGSPLPPASVLELLPRQISINDTPPISMEEHPISGLPVFFLHPCNTSSLLELSREGNTNCSLLTWFSVAVASLGIRIAPASFVKLREPLS